MKFSFPQSKFENFPTFYFSEIVIGKRSFFGTLNCSILSKFDFSAIEKRSEILRRRSKFRCFEITNLWWVKRLQKSRRRRFWSKMKIIKVTKFPSVQLWIYSYLKEIPRNSFQWDRIAKRSIIILQKDLGSSLTNNLFIKKGKIGVVRSGRIIPRLLTRRWHSLRCNWARKRFTYTSRYTKNDDFSPRLRNI